MDTLIRMRAEEINESLIDFLRASFKGKKIAIHIYEEEEMDETEYILSDPITRERILKAVENVNKNQNVREYTLEEITRFLNDEGK